MEEKKNGIFKYVMIIVVTAFITCIITTFTLSQFCSPKIKKGNNNGLESFVGNIILSMPKVSSEDEDTSINNKIFEIQQKLDELYIGEYNKEKLIDGALEGYVAAVGDEYTEYLDAEEIKALEEDVNGSYVGVGLYIAQNAQTDEITVVGIIEDSPALKVGILAGDIIKKIEQ